MKKFPSAALFAGFLAVIPAHSQETSKINFKGAQAFYEFGSIVKGVELATDTLNNVWNQRFGGTFDLQASRGEQLDLYLGAGSIFWHAVPVIATQSASKVFYSDAILTKAFLQYHNGDKENITLTGKFGFIPVKYSNSKNLGEYLFRTGTYPGFLNTGNGYTAVNTSSAAILGTQWTHKISESFTHDFFITSERQSYPLHDFSLSYLAKYKGEFLNVGLGIQLDRLIPVTPSATTPNKRNNTYFTYLGKTYTNYPEYYRLLALGATKDGNSAEALKWTTAQNLVDSLRLAWETDPASKPKMEKYTFKGIKPVAMLSLDFKSLFGGDNFHGDELLLYSEAVLMGVQNYPIYYENRMDRLAVMVGLNLPTFGWLESFNIEAERLTSKYVNGYRIAREANLPLPDFNYTQLDGYDPKDWSNDDIKWSLFLNRKLIDGVNVQAQIANDHLRGRRYTRVVTENPLLINKAHWYYMIKLQASL